MRRTIFTLIMLCIVSLTLQAQSTWTVAGSKAIFGTEWGQTDTNNDMTQNKDNLWELVKTGCILEQNIDYQFKIVSNHSWDVAYPANNYVFQVAENGTYTVTILFDESSKDIKVNTVKTGEAVIAEKTWTVAGVTALLGSEWKPEDESNDMAKQADGTYTINKKNVNLTLGDYAFKVCANHGWSESYGNASGNYIMSIEADGIYDITITFDPATHAITAKATLITPTGIKLVNKEVNKANDIIYNLQGQPVSTPKAGIYIKGQKKVIIK